MTLSFGLRTWHGRNTHALRHDTSDSENNGSGGQAADHARSHEEGAT